MKRSDTKSRIVNAAWQLFYTQGFENTTIDEIVELSGTSKGSFYHYFEGKDALPASLSYLFDEKYAELESTMDPSLSPLDKLIFMNHELFLMIENTVSVDILGRLLASQLVSSSDRSLLDAGRTYYKLLRRITIEAQNIGIFRKEFTTNDITKGYAMFERALMYDWCLSSGSYSLCQYAGEVFPAFLKTFC